jgi:hypothetical protein
MEVFLGELVEFLNGDVSVVGIALAGPVQPLGLALAFGEDGPEPIPVVAE